MLPGCPPLIAGSLNCQGLSVATAAAGVPAESSESDLATVLHALVTSSLYYCNILYVEDNPEAAIGVECVGLIGHCGSGGCTFHAISPEQY